MSRGGFVWGGFVWGGLSGGVLSAHPREEQCILMTDLTASLTTLLPPAPTSMC